MKTEVIDRNGVKLAGPDSPALADRDAVVLAPVGGVSRAQAGLLEYAEHARAHPHQVDATRSTTQGVLSVEMIDRAHAAAPGFDRETVTRIVKAALGLA